MRAVASQLCRKYMRSALIQAAEPSAKTSLPPCGAAPPPDLRCWGMLAYTNCRPGSVPPHVPFTFIIAPAANTQPGFDVDSLTGLRPEKLPAEFFQVVIPPKN